MIPRGITKLQVPKLAPSNYSLRTAQEWKLEALECKGNPLSQDIYFRVKEHQGQMALERKIILNPTIAASIGSSFGEPNSSVER
jgi:hypothetical protein